MNGLLLSEEVKLFLEYKKLKRQETEIKEKIGDRKKSNSLYARILSLILAKGTEEKNSFTLHVNESLTASYKRVGKKNKIDEQEASLLLSRLLAQGKISQEEFDKVFSKDGRYWKLTLK